MRINVEYKNKRGEFPVFFNKISGRNIAVVFDANTKPFALDLIEKISCVAKSVKQVFLDDKDLIPDEKAVETAQSGSKGTDYVLAVGSGTLNDLCKSVSYKLGVPCGVFATAASMDGYCSKGAALMRNGIKVTDDTHSPEDVLIDLDVVCSAPKIMTAAGFGDIIGKYTCLTDWKTANAVNGEEINEEAFSMMQSALNNVVSNFEALTSYSHNAVAYLMDALITAGTAMAVCGNSRPASGSEHHMSHFLEMDFARRGDRIPPHGIKVAIGTLCSIEIYNYIKDNKLKFNGCERVYEYAGELPEAEKVMEMLEKMGSPTRFSKIGVRKETFNEMIEKAYTVRDRFTVLTLSHELGISDKLKPVLMEKYF